MIDPSLRAGRIAAVFDDPENAVLLLDVVLGHGADSNPAGALAAVIVDGLAKLHGRPGPRRGGIGVRYRR